MKKILQPHQLIDQALVLLKRDGWTARQSTSDTGARCISRALVDASEFVPLGWELLDLAYSEVAAELPAGYKHNEHRADNDAGRVIGWNDEAAQSFAQVESLLLAASKASRLRSV